MLSTEETEKVFNEYIQHLEIEEYLTLNFTPNAVINNLNNLTDCTY